MLVSAAMDAVKQWRYKPYLVKEFQHELQTTTNMNFQLEYDNRFAASLKRFVEQVR